jgi:hypothetical protein
MNLEIIVFLPSYLLHYRVSENYSYMVYKSSYSRKVAGSKRESIPEWSCPVLRYYPKIHLEVKVR